MKIAHIIFPHQLFRDIRIDLSTSEVFLVEEHLFFRQYRFHKQKLVFHRASMQQYAAYLSSLGHKIHYIEAFDDLADVRQLIPALKREGYDGIRCFDPVDNWLEHRIRNACSATGMSLHIDDSPMFVNTSSELTGFFNSSKKKFFQTAFYIDQRKKYGILLDMGDKPLGGQWSFDADNRKPYPKKQQPPPVEYPGANKNHDEAVAYVEKHFPGNPGLLSAYPLYPTNHQDALHWMEQFLEMRFAGFGPYEDAIVAREHLLHHSLLSPLMNSGLLTPGQVISAVLQHAETNNIALNSTEGFVRQVLGWREFIRGMYQFHGTTQRKRNYWGFTRKIPDAFYTATTGIEPVDSTIRKVWQTGYCHHIERLMVLGNFMLLCEFDPDEVYRWFMELFIDAYDWVMVPNVYGMSQFSDGGLMATKPYISGSNYLMKMSDYKPGAWQPVWDALFWRFMHVHRDFFLSNPRLGMLIRSFDKMPSGKREYLIDSANTFLDRLN